MNKWFIKFGHYENDGDGLLFHGGLTEATDKRTGVKSTYPNYGSAVYYDSFISGTISTNVKVDINTGEPLMCHICFDIQESTNEIKYYQIGINSNGVDEGFAFSFDRYDGNKYDNIKSFGTIYNISSDGFVKMKLRIVGTKISFFVNDILVLSGDIPSPIVSSQIGLTCSSTKDILVKDYIVESDRPKAFIVMQYDKNYDDLYNDVIYPVCSEKYDIIRADKSYTTGMIMLDIIRQISESSLIIADITPDNPNVFYEVGYAHALKKQTILLTEKSKRDRLPFDISGFRVIFYENTIGGKKDVEEKLRLFLQNID